MSKRRILSEQLAGRVRRPLDTGGKKILSARILRSPAECGRLAGINLPEAPGGITALVAREIPGHAGVRFGGVNMPILAGRRILWLGQPILAAAGPDIDEVDDYLARIQLDIRNTEPESAITESEFQRVKGNPSEAFAKAFQIVEESFTVPGRIGVTEPSGSVCMRDGRTYCIYLSTAWPGAVRRSVARALDIPSSAVTVRPLSSAPGAKSHAEIWHPALSAAAAALLSWKSKRSVRLDTAPSESALGGPDVPGAEFHIRGALDSNGRVTGLECSLTVECGALLPLENEIVDRIVMGLFGIYPCRSCAITGRIRRGPRSPSTFGPAAGFELGALAGELFASKAALMSLSSPGAWRLGAFASADEGMGPGIAAPKDFPLPEILRGVIEDSDYERKSAANEHIRLMRNKLSTAPSEFRGIGLSTTGFGNGFLSSGKELKAAPLAVTLKKNGDLLIISPPGVEHLAECWVNIAGDILGTIPGRIRFTNELKPELNEPGPSILGRNTAVYTRLLELTCQDLAKRRFRDALPISVSRSRRRGAGKPWNREKLEGSPFEIYSWGAGVVEVTVSSSTGGISSIRCWLVIDGGRLLMREQAEASVENAVEEALYWCMGERKPVPSINLEFYGNQVRRISRDVSTLPWLLMPAAFVQAVRQASGTLIDRLPITPERIWTGVSAE